MTKEVETEITEECSEVVVSRKQERELRRLVSKSRHKEKMADLGYQIESQEDPIVYNSNIGSIDDDDEILEVFEDE